MSFSSWLSRGLMASAMSSCLLLTGCGETPATDANAKSEPVKEVPVEAAAPALEVASNDPSMPEGDVGAAKVRKPQTKDGDGVGDDIVSKLEIPIPVSSDTASSGEPDPSINPADAVHRGPWTSNMAAAKKQAKAEGKDILMDFTGSDWCGYCIELNKTVFSKDEFLKYAPKKFVLVELDFPKGFRLDPQVQQQNQALQSAFGIEGFPSIVLADADGRPYAQTGFQPGGPAKYIAHLEELRAIKTARDAKFKAAEAAKGVGRAKLLAEGLALLTGRDKQLSPEALLPAYASLANEIVSLDADGSAGLKKDWSDRLKHAGFVARINKLNEFARENYENVPVMLTEIGRVEAEFKDYGPGLAQLRNFKFRILLTNKMFPEFHMASDAALAATTISAEERLEIMGLKLSILVRDRQYADAEKVLAGGLAAVKDDKAYVTQVHLFRARLAAVQKKVPEAKAAIKQARAAGADDLKEAIDQFEKDLLSELDNDAPVLNPKGN